MRRKIVLKAVHDTDLERVLRKIGVYSDVVEGRCRCFVCGKTISLENLGGFFKDVDGKIKFVCEDIRCLIVATVLTSRRVRE